MLLGLMLLNAFGLVLVYSLLREGEPGFGLVIAIVTIGFNVIMFVPRLYPLRWMSPGLALMTMLVVYPVIYTVQNAFTNYGDGHLFGKSQAIRLIADRGYVPDDARTFTYTPYRGGEDDFALWLVDDRTGEIIFAEQGEPLREIDLADFGFTMPPVATSDGFAQLDQPGPLIGALGGQTLELEFAEPVGLIAVALSAPQNVETSARYVVAATQGIIYDRETETSVPVTVLQRGDEFGFAWDAEDGTSYLVRPDEPIYIGRLPVIDGFERVGIEAVIEAGISSFSFDAPVGQIPIRPIDPATQDSFGIYSLTPQYVFDPVQSLTINQRNARVYDTTYFENEAGDFALWLTESGLRRINRALLILPGQNIREIDVGNRRLMDTLGIRLSAGAFIPDRIGAFNRVPAPEDIIDTVLEDVTAGFAIREFDFNAGFVLDAEQELAIDYRTGLVYEIAVFQSEDGEFALWMDSDTRERGRLDKVLARPGETLFLNGTPADFRGFTLALDDRERAEAVAFLQDIEVDYFGAPDDPPNERIGIIPAQLGRAGQPFFLRYIFNGTEQAFVDLSTVDAARMNISALNLEQETPYNAPGFLSVVQYLADDSTGTFDGVRLRFVYNEVEEAWLDLNSVSLTNVDDVTGPDIATRPPGSIPGFGGATMFNEFPEAGVFAPVGWVYNAGVDAFVDARGEPGLEDVTVEALRDSGVAYVVKNEVAGIYAPSEWVYNETDGQFINLTGIDRDALDLEGIDLAALDLPLIDLLTGDQLTVYQRFADQGVYAPQNWVFNEAANAFVDVASIPPSAEISAEEAATADLSDDAFTRATILFFDEATNSYVPADYFWVEALEGYVDLSRIDAVEGVEDPAPIVNELVEEGVIVTAFALNVAREPLLYHDTTRPTRNDKVDGYIYLAEGVRVDGVDLATFNPDTLDTIAGATLVRSQFNSVRISPLIYEETLRRPQIDSERYVLALDSSAPTLNPGYRVNIGLLNFQRLIDDPRLYGPLLDIFVWTVTFALLSVFITFVVGLFMAIILNDEGIPGKKVIRSLLIIPYAIPGVIGIIVWQGMLNQNLGIITNTFVDLFGVRPQWFTDPTLAKVAILLVNLWLGYPYMMLICSGALQAIPSDVYEAAAVDGARVFQRFWNITLPLLLVTVGPLLIASFTFNFNNYLLIELLTQGNPPIPNTPTPAGYTDILISYTYNLAFGTDRGAQYGYASAITIVIFALVAVVTMIQFRFTRQWEEVGENV